MFLARRTYFVAASVLLLGLTLSAFWDNLVTNLGQASNYDPKFIVHGLFCGAWIIVLLTQATLAAQGNVQLHRKLGFVALTIAIGVTLSTIWVFVAVWKGWAAMGLEAKSNRLLLPSYSLFVALGFLNRHRPDWHKRFMYSGTLFMLQPVLARAFDPLLVPLMIGFTEAQIEAAYLPSLFGVWLAFFVSLIAYDLIVIRRIHPVTIGALLWFGGIWAIVNVV